MNLSAALSDTTIGLNNITMTDSSTHTGFQQQIDKINESLLLANIKIDHLNLENQQLKVELNKYKNLIEGNKGHCSSDTPVSTMKRKRKRPRLSVSVLESGDSHSGNTKQNTNIEEEKPSVSLIGISKPAIAVKQDKVNNLKNCEHTSNTHHWIPELDTPHTNTSNHQNNKHTSTTFNGTPEPDTKHTNASHETPDYTYISLPAFMENITTTQICQNKYCRKTHIEGEEAKINRQKVLLVADETGRGLGTRLQLLLGENYIVETFIKPYALLDQVVNTCAISCKDFKKNDFVIILAGANDKSPLSVQSYLYHTLNQLKHTNVLVGKVYKNRAMNLHNLNRLMKHVCIHCSNSVFVSLDTDCVSEETASYRLDISQASRLLHREILRISYTNNYINYTVKTRREQQRKSMPHYNDFRQDRLSSAAVENGYSGSFASAIRRTDVTETTTQTENSVGLKFFRE